MRSFINPHSFETRMGKPLQIESFTIAGGHTVNEDAFCCRPHPVDADMWICFVADGVGGQSGGGRAAQVGCESAFAAAAALAPEQLAQPRQWLDILSRVDDAVAADPDAGFTTFVGLCVHGESIVGASVGDSAALLISLGWAKELSSGQSRKPVIGSGLAKSVPFEARFGSPGKLLVMSDGGLEIR